MTGQGTGAVVSRAAEFLRDNGRDIDQARFAFYFGSATLETLLEVLGRYQNPDGGFGHKLEVDIAARDSNPFATELALLICLQADVPRNHELLRRTVDHLETTQDQDGGWRFSENVYADELAPWFQTWNWPNLNPACTIGGLLRALGLGSDALHKRVEGLFERLADVNDLAEGDFYSVRPYAYYFLPVWRSPSRELYLSGVLWWLIRSHLADTIADGAHFFEYVRGPNTTIGARLPKPLVAARLDMLEAEQAEDGGWPSPYASAWRPWVTVQNLLVLRAFGRI
jgi:hypothetical protein